jgi:hypothetical protein
VLIREKPFTEKSTDVKYPVSVPDPVLRVSDNAEVFYFCRTVSQALSAVKTNGQNVFHLGRRLKLVVRKTFDQIYPSPGGIDLLTRVFIGRTDDPAVAAVRTFIDQIGQIFIILLFQKNLL